MTSLGVVVLGLSLTACTSDADTPGTTETSASTAAVSPAQNSGTSLDNEVRGDIATGSLWALFYHRRSYEPLKTIWRMTGTGDLSVEATGPRGQTIHPDGVPEPHAGSNWDRPGDEWGSSGRSRNRAAGRSTPNGATADPEPSPSISPERSARLSTGSWSARRAR